MDVADEPGSAAHVEVSPVRELLGDAKFRRFWIAQILMSGVNGTSRFVFIWVIVTLTDWPSAEGLVGIALGLPALVLSLPAGAWSDRVDRRRFFLWWGSASAVLFAIFTAVVAADLATPLLTGVAALLVGTTVTMTMPNLAAIVPLLVRRERLMNATALQNGGSQAASFLGLAIGGGAIALFGNAAGFGLLAAVSLLSVVLMTGVTIPADDHEREGQHILREILDGLRYGLADEPRRTLLVVTLILGSSFSVMQITMPRVVDEEYQLGSGAAGILLGTFGVGMLVSSALIARRHGMRHGRNIALFIGIGLGMGQFLLSLSPTYWAAMVVMVAWGLNAGVAIASHRTLLQQVTEPAMMGRVMGIMMLGFAGGLPFGALAQSLLAPAVGPVLTMRYVGLVTMAITIPLLWRKTIRRL